MTRCYIIAEVGLSHMGETARAIESVRAFAEAGADAVKFQDHFGQLVPDGQRHPSPHVRMTRAAWYAMTSFTWDQWKSVRDACERSNVDYIVSPFSVEALRRQLELRPRYIKIASGEVTNRELLQAVATCGVEVIVSCGMTSDDELNAADAIFDAGSYPSDNPWWMHCVSEYPCAPEHARLCENHHEPPCYSDHTTGIWFPIAAVALGATMIEKHAQLDASRPHSDSDIALTPDKFREMVEGIRAVEKALYEPSEPDLTEIRKVYLHAP